MQLIQYDKNNVVVFTFSTVDTVTVACVFISFSFFFCHVYLIPFFVKYSAIFSQIRNAFHTCSIIGKTFLCASEKGVRHHDVLGEDDLLIEVEGPSSSGDGDFEFEIVSLWEFAKADCLIDDAVFPLRDSSS